MGATFSKMVRRAILGGCTVMLLAAPVGAEVSQREQLKAAQKAYEASAKSYNEAVQAGAKAASDTARVVVHTTIGAVTGGPKGALAGAANAALSIHREDKAKGKK